LPSPPKETAKPNTAVNGSGITSRASALCKHRFLALFMRRTSADCRINRPLLLSQATALPDERQAVSCLTFAHINGMVPVFVWRVQKGDAIYSKWGAAYPPAHPVCPPTAHPWRCLGVAIERRELSDIRKEHACVRALMQYSIGV
jgi:hypothetical protein